jgi:hypothetical protein
MLFLAVNHVIGFPKESLESKVSCLQKNTNPHISKFKMMTLNEF